MMFDAQKPTFEEMWKFMKERLAARGKIPDKASLDYKQASEIYTVLLAEEMMFREMVQVAILRKETDTIKNL